MESMTGTGSSRKEERESQRSSTSITYKAQDHDWLTGAEIHSLQVGMIWRDDVSLPSQLRKIWAAVAGNAVSPAN